MKIVYDDTYNKIHSMKALIRADYVDAYRTLREGYVTVEEYIGGCEELHKSHLEWINNTFTALDNTNEDGVIGVCVDMGAIGELTEYADMVHKVFVTCEEYGNACGTGHSMVNHRQEEKKHG